MDGGGSRYDYKSALILAIDKQQWDIAETLILANADVNLPSWKSETGSSVVLNSYYLERQHTPLTKLIDDFSTNPKLEKVQLNLVKLLLKHGANIDTSAIFIDRAEGSEIITMEKYTALQLTKTKKWYGDLSWRPVHYKIFQLLKHTTAEEKRRGALFIGGTLVTASLSGIVAYKASAKVFQLFGQPNSLGNVSQALGYGYMACCASAIAFISAFGLYTIVEHKIQKASGNESFVDQLNQGLNCKTRASMRPNHDQANSNSERSNS